MHNLKSVYNSIKVYSKAFSIILGIIDPSKGQEISKQGFVLT